MKISIKYLIVLILLSACNTKETYIPDVYVNIEINLNLPEYSELNTIGNSIFIEGGNAGIIIYHFAENTYKIYDRTCSWEPLLECSFIDSLNSTIAYCNCCTSAFLLDQEGNAINSPALLPLKQYRYSIQANHVLHIFN
tara:strand:+ start:150 stop:566 length:417 start_codon:yes stop_codon:yes gene_type:complete